VYLDDLRCDGSGHGGCQAGCKIYWKEAWLRRVDAGSGSVAPKQREEPVRDKAVAAGNEGAAELKRLAEAGARAAGEPGDDPREVWRCQATDALKASKPLKTSNLFQYWRELRNGNFRPLRFIRLLARAFVMELANRLGLLRPLPLHGPAKQSPPAAPLDIRPGELVRVRSPSEIEATLDDQGLNRGLSFDREMLPYCGRKFRVKDKVQRIIDDRTGRMLKIPKDCLVLDGAVCSGARSAGRWFCPRQIYPFWREAWLSRVDDSQDTESEDGRVARSSESGRLAQSSELEDRRAAPSSERSMPHV
jgi:hypothetical protein